MSAENTKNQNNSSAVAPAKGSGCVTGCLIAAAVLVVLSFIAGGIVYWQGPQLMKQFLTGGGVEVTAPAGFQEIPVPFGLAAEGIRSSSFVGKGSPQETREIFEGVVEQAGWRPMGDANQHYKESFRFLTPDSEKPAAGMEFVLYEKGSDILFLYVVGVDKGAMASLISAPRDSEMFKQQ